MSFSKWVEEKKKKEQGQTSGTTPSTSATQQSTSKSFSEWRTNKEADKVTQEYINSFITDANSFLSSAEKEYGELTWGSASDAFSSRLATSTQLRRRASAIGTWLERNKNNINEEAYKSLYDAVKSFESDATSIADGFREKRDFYSQFGSEDEYNEWYKDYKATQDILNSEDFEYYSQQGANIENPSVKEAEGFMTIGQFRLGGKDIGNIVTYSRDNDLELRIGAANGSEMLGDFRYSHMTDTEVGIYNYYLAKYGKDKAAEYLKSIDDDLTKMEAGQIAKRVSGDAFLEATFSIIAGLDQAAWEIGNIDNLLKGTEADPTTVTQYANGQIRGNIDGIGGVAYDLSQNIAHMLPSILVGSLTGGIGGAVTLGTSAASGAYAEMRNDGYNEWQARGYGLLVGASEAALQYALGGISPLGNAKGGMLNKVTEAALKNVDNALARFAINVGSNMFEEGFEEAAQSVLEPIFKGIFTGKGADIDWGEVAYSGLLGVLSAGTLEGVPTLAGTVDSNYKTNVQMGGLSNKGAVNAFFKGNENGTKGFKGVSEAYKAGKQNVNEAAGHYVNKAIEIDSDNAHAQRMQARLDKGKDVSGYQLNRIVEANENALVSQDKSKMKSAVEARLTELGETGDIGKLADVIVKAQSGETLTRSESKVLTESKYGRRVSTEMNPQMIESGEYTSKWAEKIGTERINAEAYSRGLYDLAEEVASVAPNAEEKHSVAENTPTKEIATEGKFEASEDGKTTYNGNEVKIARIAPSENGEVMVQLGNGEVVNARDVEFSSHEEALIYEATADMDIDTANDFVQGFISMKNAPLATHQTALDYKVGFNEAATYGELGIPYEALARDGKYANALVGNQAQIAYNRGKINGVNKAATAKKDAPGKAVSGQQKSPRKYKGETHVSEIKKSRVYKEMSDTQKAGIDGMTAMYKALGIDVYFFESPTDAKGKRLGKNGYFNPEDNSVHIDLYAGLDGRGTILFTSGHELTHYIRVNLPSKFKAFADLLFEKYEANGTSVASLIAKKKADLDKLGRLDGLTPEQALDLAYEETVADACEAMLADGKAFAELSEKVKAKDKGLWNAIKKFFTDLVAKIKAAYENLSPDSVAGSKLAEMLDTAEELRSMWVDMLVEASEQSQYTTDNIRGNADGAVVQSEVTEALVEGVAENGVLESTRTEYEALPKQVMSLSTGVGSILYSIEGLDPLKVNGLTDRGINGYTGRAVREFAMKNSGFAKKQISEVNKFMDAMADFMKEAGVTYRFIGLQDVENATLHYTYNSDGSIKSVVLSAMVKNGDYPVNFDLSSICKKRVAMSALIDKLAKRGSIDNGTVKLTPSNIFKINTALKDAGYETACLGCFVESKRYNSLEWAKKFCDKWNAAVKKVNPNATYFGYGNETFNEDSFTVEQAIKIDAAANKYIKATKTERLANALAKYKAKEQAGEPLVAGKVMKVDGEELNTFSKAARDRLMKSDTISDELKTKYLTCDVSTLNMADVEFLLENGILPGANLSNKQAVTEMVKSGEAYQHLLKPSDLLTDRGISKLEALPNFHGVLYGHYGSGTPKLMQSYTPYNSEIALLPAQKNSDQTLAEYLYTIAGVRMQSFSDFQIQNIYDYLQMVADLAARKLPAHAYTKEISFAKLLGMTGIKVNLSVMFDIDPMVDKAHAGLTKLNPLVHKGEYAKVILEDAQGKWVYNIGDYQTQRMFEEAYPDEAKRFLQSIGFADAVKLQSSNGYSANCGIIGVGYSDLGIFAMLDDNRIRYIIPYHASSLPADIKVATHIDIGTDYTPYQNNMKIVGIEDRNGNKVNWSIKEAYKRLGSGQAVINELNNKIRNEGWVVTTKKAQNGHGTYGLYENLQETGDPRKTASNFMDWCIGNNTLPLFYQFASHNNYYKMLYDFNVYDCVTEEYAPQQAVTNTYPTMVDGEVKAGTVTDGGFNVEYLQGTIDKQMAFMNQYGENLDSDLEKLADNMEEGNYSLRDKAISNGKLMFSDRDSEGKTLSEGQQEFFKDSKVRDADGNLLPVYHSTDADFNEFEADTATAGDIYYFAVSKTWSQNFFKETYYHKPNYTKRLYLNVTNPIDLRGVPGRGIEYMEYENRQYSHEEIMDLFKKKQTFYYMYGGIPVINVEKQTLRHSGETWTVKDLIKTINAGIKRKHLGKGFGGSKWIEFFQSIGINLSEKFISVWSAPQKNQSDIPAWLLFRYDGVSGNLRESLIEAGYDGVVMPDTLHGRSDNTAYAAFYKDQIKLTSNKTPTSNPDIRYSDRDPDSVSNRSLLANALESVAQEGDERNTLRNYKTNLRMLEAEQAKLADVKGKANEIRFKKGRTDEETKKLKGLDIEAKKIATRINSYDRELLKLEAMQPIKDVLNREKQQAYKKAEQKGREALSDYFGGRKKAEMRRRIFNVTKNLGKLLNRGTKKQNVKEGLRATVASSLKLAELLFNDSIQNADIVRLGVEIATKKESGLLAEYSTLLDTIEELKEKRELLMGAEKVSEALLVKVGSVEDEITKARNRIATLDKKLSDVFERERARLNRATVDQLVADLATEYLKLKDSDSDYIRAAFDEYKYQRLDALKRAIGGTPVKDMSMAQLAELYDAYKMVEHFVRNANKSFKEQKGQTIMQMAEAVNDQVRTVAGQPYKRNVISAWLQREGWHLLKPYVAFRTIGSDTLTNLYKNLREGEDTFYNDVSSATAFIEEQYKKHGYKSWDMKKTKTFTAKSGKSFDLTIEQMMTLYAYYQRPKAHKHIIEGGIVFENSLITEKNKLGVPIKYEVTTKDAFNLSEETFKGICDYLEKNHKDVVAFVKEMQAYLSDTMGAKGNEVSLKLEGIKLFTEEFYLPIKSSQYYMNFTAEEAGEVKLKSPGFSKETTPGANNPIVLHNFTDLWAEHINDMSMYHSFVLALEDFTRVYNYKTRTDAKVETMDTKATIETAYPGATKYISKFLKDLNGGVRGETVGWAEKLTSLAKKGAVLGSASVAVQQPSAVMRAMAIINPKHFVATTAKSFNLAKHKQDWAELKKYAPIAGIKEMGKFDVGMGKGTVELIKSNETAMGKIDDFLGMAPEFMDEVTWVSIWNAVKRETVHKYKNLRPGSEEFLKVAGERFTDVISLTQVYDSVFSRSDLMRNKALVAKWLTSFMAEPTTTLNMLIDSYVQGKRTGSKKGFVKTVASTGGAVVASIVFNSLLKSIVMAARDDDEDESYAEKYLEHFVGDLKDNLNPLTLIPVVKDVLSIFDGYDVERMDMSLVSDFKKAIEAFNSDNKTAYEKWSGLIGAVSAMFGVPVKNVERDIRAAINTFFGKKESTTKQGLLDAVSEGWTGNSKSNGQQLYEAMMSGDTEQIERVKGRFKDDKAITSAIRSALRENDSRIHDAAVARYNGNIAEYTRIAREIIAEGIFKQDDVVSAINTEINALKKGEGTTASTADSNKATSIYKVEDYFTAIIGRDQATAYVVKEDIIKTAMANGKDRDEAEQAFNSSFANHLRDEYDAGMVTDYEAINMLVNYGGKSEEDASSKVQYWEFKNRYPDYDLSEEAVKKYYSEVEPSGINIKDYYDYSKLRSKCKGTDANGDGKTDSGSVKREVLDVINSLPISSYQKDVLYYLNGWSASTIWEAPWH